MKHSRIGSLWIAIAFVATPLLGWTEDIQLPPPQKAGGMPLFEALAKRTTSRSFRADELSMDQISSLLWAAFGVNRPDGRRTAPSALNKKEIDVYVLLTRGAFMYNAVSNQLTRISSGNLMKLGGTQDFVTNAPLHMVMVADLSKMAGTNEVSKLNTAYADAGYISQNIYLYCTSAGLATGARLSVDRAALAKALKLRPDHAIILAHSVGYPK